MKKTIAGLLIITLIFATVLTFNWYQKPRHLQIDSSVKSLFQNDNQLAETLSRLIQFKTISSNETANNHSAPFRELIQFLKQRFPLVYESLEVIQIDQSALIYIWKGTNPDLKPIMLTAHFDVVPDENIGNWEKDPFLGKIEDGFIWGRGALDDKSAIVSILHSTSKLIEDGFEPQRTTILAFGGDEEIGGIQGALKISKLLESKNIQLEYILDEGMPITDGIMQGINKPVAMIGIAEKGYLNVKLTASTIDGHTSSPPRQTSVGILSSAIAKLEANPMHANLSGPIGLMFDALAREMNPLQGIAVSNRWLFAPALTIQLAKQNSTNALIRTTMATTMIQGSMQANVLPKTASATINIRILPGDSIDKILSHIRATIEDPSVEVSIIGEQTEPSQISDTVTFGYATISKSIAQVFPDVLIAPSLLIASTDTKHYKQLTNSIYRFRPLWVKPEDISRFHGSNERIAKNNLEQMTMFYYQLILNSSKN